MNALEIYNSLFKEILSQDAETLAELRYQDIPEWDSVGHMSLITAIEEAFDIMLESEDIIDFSSWCKGIDILKKYNVGMP
jgi:acyl carrier protein